MRMETDMGMAAMEMVVVMAVGNGIIAFVFCSGQCSE